MRARVAYISSLGTTAILVAAALLMLAVVGALVAFRGWPGSANGAMVQQVPLGPGSGAARTVLVRPAASTKQVVRVRAFAASAVTKARSVSTAGLVKQPGPAVVSGIVMEPVIPMTMHPTGSQPRGDSPAAAVQPAVVPPETPAPAYTTTVPADPTGPLAGLPPVDPNGPAQPSPQAPSSDQVISMVGALIDTPPPPSVGSVVDRLH